MKVYSATQARAILRNGLGYYATDPFAYENTDFLDRAEAYAGTILDAVEFLRGEP